MTAGLLLLASNSRESVFMTFKPEITFFKTVYKRHTNFSIEPIPQYFINPLDFGKQSTVSISKTGDLITDIYLEITLPNLSNVGNNNYNISYVKNLGYALIRKVEIEIGGVVLSRLYGEWFYIWKELTTPLEQKRGVDIILGNIEEFTKPEKEKPSLKLIIPLFFWFNNGVGNALPLVSLTDDIKIHIELRSLTDVIIQSPQKYFKINENFCSLERGDYIYQNVNGEKKIGIFYNYDLINNLIYYDELVGEIDLDYPITNEFNEIYTINNSTNTFGRVLDNFGKVADFFLLNYPSIVSANCLINYVFLDNEERYLYLTKNHEYLVQVPQNLIEETYNSSNVKYNLDFIHPISSIYFRVILEQNIKNKDYFEYSLFPLSNQPILENFEYKGQKLVNNDSIIKNIKMVFNGQELSNVNNPNFYNLIQKLQYFDGYGNQFIYKYSFSIDPKDPNQPYGSLNFSKIDDAYIQFNLDGNINYLNPVRIKAFALNYNIFRIVNGIGNFVFNV